MDRNEMAITSTAMEISAPGATMNESPSWEDEVGKKEGKDKQKTEKKKRRAKQYVSWIL